MVKKKDWQQYSELNVTASSPTHWLAAQGSLVAILRPSPHATKPRHLTDHSLVPPGTSLAGGYVAGRNPGITHRQICQHVSIKYACIIPCNQPVLILRGISILSSTICYNMLQYVHVVTVLRQCHCSRNKKHI
jgi:hypothetical protein